jgi:hypothetical protein
MKNFKLLWIALSLFIASSCQPDNPDPNNSNTAIQISWQFNIGGTNYSWTGLYPDDTEGTSSNYGSSQFSVTGTYGSLSFVKTLQNGITILASTPNIAIGTTNYTPSNFSSSSLFSFTENYNLKYSSGFAGSNVTLTINSLSPNTVAANGQYGAGLVSGTISGTIGVNPTLGGGTKTISGTFSAVRIN